MPDGDIPRFLDLHVHQLKELKRWPKRRQTHRFIGLCLCLGGMTLCIECSGVTDTGLGEYACRLSWPVSAPVHPFYCVRVTGFPTQPKTATWSPASKASSPSKTSSGTSGGQRSCGVWCPRPRWSGRADTQVQTDATYKLNHSRSFAPSRRLMDIVSAHRSTDFDYKLNALSLFKQTVSEEAPEFCDDMQKASLSGLAAPVDRRCWHHFIRQNHRPPTCLCVQDAHEFLTTVLYQIRKLSPVLEQIAASRGKRYSCPVEEHLLFKMQTIRTCMRSGALVLSGLGCSWVLASTAWMRGNDIFGSVRHQGWNLTDPRLPQHGKL